MSRPMTIAQFAEKIGVTKRTLMRWHEDGKLVPAFVLPSGERRYTEDQVDQLRGKAKDPKRRRFDEAMAEERKCYKEWQESPLAKEEDGFLRWEAARKRLCHVILSMGPGGAELAEKWGFNADEEDFRG